ncbi:type IV toxin-antitoxin system AbiEi family antitoxin domain-containing protein [Jiangella asiatica]|uniref:AbiEi antitoxin N-terminal domain-containing protein n=1 Tax=Jiangella asiatica TaxID=2530372 RepID=A0A4R5DD10_9ACTN|nr:type IV toxin-antitoxin system AbiEi family antitoxin domain-containing protein [Jiangella asiatica]TDE09524.1 hypothetical protein E1269_14530 [Jiangella asiatica]
MDETLRAVAARQHGVVVRAQVLAAGYDDYEIARRRATGAWVAIRRGAYVEATVWKRMNDLELHRARCQAVLLQMAVPAVLSHTSAAVWLGTRVWGADLSCVHVSRRDLHAPRREAGVHHHAGRLSEAEVRVVDGVATTTPARTALDVARTTPFESAVVTVDGILAESATTSAELLEVLDTMRDWRGARAAGRVVEFADGRSESVGESRHRVQLERIGLPRPELQLNLPGPDGTDDRVDFYFEGYATIGEFDGREKYGRLLRPGESAGDAVWREKIREDRLRDRGLQVVRSVWADLYRDDLVAARYRAAFGRGRRRVVA